MREILFRGKTKAQHKGVTTEKPIKANMWVFGNLTVGKLEGYKTDMISDKREIYSIIPETVGQFTGATDKNGKKIFEGDVVKNTFEEGNAEYLVVVWTEPYCRFELEETKTKQRVELLKHEEAVEVVGNIHDNPELLR